ncbi:hypothetical protein HWV62_22247 [Athelia sp. TMB]|nr:hypothetical protein HWV62_22247 [Athelia sp. TMB]
MSQWSDFDLPALKAELGSEELALYLDDCMEVADDDAKDFTARDAESKALLVGGASIITIVFKPGPAGSGPCTKKGSGAFTGKLAPANLGGRQVDLVVSRTTVKLVDNGVEIWKGKGLQKGLTGTWKVAF